MVGINFRNLINKITLLILIFLMMKVITIMMIIAKFDDYSQITTENLTLRPINSTCGTYLYETAKALSKYFAPLAENEHTIKNEILDFAGNVESRSVNKLLVSYDVTSLFNFTEIPLRETIDHVLEEIYDHNKHAQITSKLVMKRLFERVTKGTVFSFKGKLYKQADGRRMGNHLSATLANIFMCNSRRALLSPETSRFMIMYDI